jgi:predicted metal-binding membrane protein
MPRSWNYGAVNQPVSAYGLLERRTTVVMVSVLLGLGAVGWLSTVRYAQDMSGMAIGLGQIGVQMPMTMTVPLFLAMWVSMMVAMMFPTVAPMVLAHRMVVQRRGEGWLPTVAFIGGYLIVWTVIGVVPLVALLLFAHIAAGPWTAWAGGGALIVAGLYQFTPWKGTCLKACRSPLSFVVQHDFGQGWRSAIRAGMSHGAYCLGCCWALMAVLVVVGLMNLIWMVAIALVFLLEKNWSRGAWVPRAAGTVIALLGVLIIIRPELLAWISGAGAMASGHM